MPFDVLNTQSPFTIDDDLFFETLLLMIRGETIKFSAELKRKNKSKENELETEIAQLENNLKDSSFNDLAYKKRARDLEKKLGVWSYC